MPRVLVLSSAREAAVAQMHTELLKDAGYEVEVVRAGHDSTVSTASGSAWRRAVRYLFDLVLAPSMNSFRVRKLDIQHFDAIVCADARFAWSAWNLAKDKAEVPVSLDVHYILECLGRA